MRVACELIIADQPTINGRVYSKEVMAQMESQMKEMISNNALLIYDNAMPDFNKPFSSPSFDKVVGRVVGVSLTNMFEFDVENIHTEYSKCVDFSNTELLLIPVVVGEVKKNEDTGHNEVHDVNFHYLNLGIKGKDYRLISEVE